MNMQINATRYSLSNAHEMPGNAAAIRKGLMNPPMKVVSAPVIMLAKPKPIAPVVRTTQPLWEKMPLAFDHHVTIHFHAMEAARIMEAAGLDFEAAKKRGTIRMVINEVLAKYPGVTIGEIMGPRRERRIVVPRHEAIWAVRNARPDLSYPAIGRIFGGRDHSSILSAVRKVDRKMLCEKKEPS